MHAFFLVNSPKTSLLFFLLVHLKYFFSFIGLTDIKNETYVQDAEVLNIFLHPNYRIGSHFDYDIALLQLDRPIKYNPFVRPICLPPVGKKLCPALSNLEDLIKLSISDFYNFFSFKNCLRIVHSTAQRSSLGQLDGDMRELCKPTMS